MPNPGFYHQAWEDRRSGLAETHRRLLAHVAGVLRKRGQPISAADLIAADATARGLAALRGHGVVWRRDLVDGIAAALVKDESSEGRTHPLLDAVHEVFRGGERGRLAEGTVLPPLVLDLKQRLEEYGWEPDQRPREFELVLDAEADRLKSRSCIRSPCWASRGSRGWAGPTSPDATTWCGAGSDGGSPGRPSWMPRPSRRRGMARRSPRRPRRGCSRPPNGSSAMPGPPHGSFSTPCSRASTRSWANCTIASPS